MLSAEHQAVVDALGTLPPPAARSARAALLRRDVRGGDRGRDGHQPGHREVDRKPCAGRRAADDGRPSREGMSRERGEQQGNRGPRRRGGSGRAPPRRGTAGAGVARGAVLGGGARTGQARRPQARGSEARGPQAVRPEVHGPEATGPESGGPEFARGATGEAGPPGSGGTDPGRPVRAARARGPVGPAARRAASGTRSRRAARPRPAHPAAGRPAPDDQGRDRRPGTGRGAHPQQQSVRGAAPTGPPGPLGPARAGRHGGARPPRVPRTSGCAWRCSSASSPARSSGPRSPCCRCSIPGCSPPWADLRSEGDGRPVGRADRLADPGEQATEPARGPMDSGRDGGDRAHRRFLGLGGSAAVCGTDRTEERSGAPRRRTTQPVVHRELVHREQAHAERVARRRTSGHVISAPSGATAAQPPGVNGGLNRAGGPPRRRCRRRCRCHCCGSTAAARAAWPAHTCRSPPR